MSKNPVTKNIAFWSGPRNISTALMRAWENRSDTEVWDEPLYGHYLATHGVEHPGRDRIVATVECDGVRVIQAMLGGRPPHLADGAPAPRIHYQKQMAHHLSEQLGRRWWGRLTHGFLIREPRQMLLSLSARLSHFTLRETGLPQQVALFRAERSRLGIVPPVVDTGDLLSNPRGVLSRLCRALEVPFDEHMLSWAAGPRDSDGVWAEYWYDNVLRSTGFRPPRPAAARQLPEELRQLEFLCTPLYEELHQHRLRGNT